MRKKQKIRIRKSTKYIYTIIATIMLVASSINLFSILSRENIINNQKENWSFQFDKILHNVPQEYSHMVKQVQVKHLQYQAHQITLIIEV